MQLRTRDRAVPVARAGEKGWEKGGGTGELFWRLVEDSETARVARTSAGPQHPRPTLPGGVQSGVDGLHPAAALIGVRVYFSNRKRTTPAVLGALQLTRRWS